MSVQGPTTASANLAPREGGRLPLRVLVGVHDGMVSGVNTYIEYVAAAAATAVDHVTLVVAGDALAGDVTARLAGTGVRVMSLALAPPNSVEALRVRLSPAFAAHRLSAAATRALPRLGTSFDAVHLNHPHLAPVLRPAARRVYVAAWFYPHLLRSRVARTWVHSGGRFPRNAGLALKGALHYRNDERGYRDADLVVTPTHLLANHLRRLGIAAVQCSPPARSLQLSPFIEGRRPPGIPRLLVCCGDLSHPRKNVALALTAAAVLAQQGMALELELVGANANALEPELRRLPGTVAVTRAGRLAATTVHQRMRMADALLLPSRYEEWGYVAVEAAFQGTPTVALPVYPFAEMLEPPLGVIAGGTTPVQYANAIAGIVREPPPRDAVRARAEERFGLVSAGRALAAIWSRRGIADDVSRAADAQN